MSVLCLCVGGTLSNSNEYNPGEAGIVSSLSDTIVAKESEGVFLSLWMGELGREAAIRGKKGEKVYFISRPASSSGETNMARNSLNIHAPQAPVFIERSFIVETTWTAAVLC